jgi:hypothetical protein
MKSPALFTDAQLARLHAHAKANPDFAADPAIAGWLTLPRVYGVQLKPVDTPMTRLLVSKAGGREAVAAVWS